MQAVLFALLREALARATERTTVLAALAHYLPSLSPDLAQHLTPLVTDGAALVLFLIPDPQGLDAIAAKLRAVAAPAAAVILALVLLSGCAEVQSGAAALDNAATKMVQNVNDDALHVEIQGLCAQPYSSLVRNVGTVKGLAAGILALCGPVPAPGASAVFGGVVQTPSGTPAP